MTLPNVGLLNPLHGSQRVKYGLALPAFVFIIVGIIYPTGYLLYNSMTNWSLTRLDLGQTFIGLENYGKLLADERFYSSLGITAAFTIATTSIQTILGLSLALLLNRNIRGEGLVRALLLIPWLVAPFISGFNFRFMMAPNIGVIAQMLDALGLDVITKTSILGSPKTALVLLILLPTAQAQDVAISIGSETGVHADALIANADRCAMEVGVAYEAHQLPPGEWINSILPTEAAVRSGLYDIAYIPISKIPQFVAAEYLLPLEDFDIEALDPDDIAFFNLTEYEGNHWLVPWLNEYQGILYRSDLINDADEQAAFMEAYGYELAAPRSRRQYYDQVAFFHRPDEDFYGNIAYGLRAGWINILHEALHFMYGVDIADNDTLEVNVNTDAGRAVLADMEMLYSMADPASFTAGWVEGNANFTAGRDYSLVTWNSVLLYGNDPETSQVAGNIGFQLLPLPDDGIENPKGFLSQWGPALSSTSENPDKAFEMLVCLTNTESGVLGVTETKLGNSPARISVLQDERALARFPWLGDIAAGIQGLNIISTPSIPEWGSMVRGDVLPRNLSTFISGESSVEETAETIEAEILQILRDGGHIE